MDPAQCRLTAGGAATMAGLPARPFEEGPRLVGVAVLSEKTKAIKAIAKFELEADRVLVGKLHPEALRAEKAQRHLSLGGVVEPRDLLHGPRLNGV